MYPCSIYWNEIIELNALESDSKRIFQHILLLPYATKLELD